MSRMGWVLMVEVSGGRLRGRPRLGRPDAWPPDSVKVALGNREMTVEAARQCERYERVESPGAHGTE